MISEETRDWFKFTLGSGSHMNLAGKIVFAPLVVFIGVLWAVLDILFAKQKP